MPEPTAVGEGVRGQAGGPPLHRRDQQVAVGGRQVLLRARHGDRAPPVPGVVEQQHPVGHPDGNRLHGQDPDLPRRAQAGRQAALPCAAARPRIGRRQPGRAVRAPLHVQDPVTGPVDGPDRAALRDLDTPPLRALACVEAEQGALRRGEGCAAHHGHGLSSARGEVLAPQRPAGVQVHGRDLCPAPRPGAAPVAPPVRDDAGVLRRGAAQLAHRGPLGSGQPPAGPALRVDEVQAVRPRPYQLGRPRPQHADRLSRHGLHRLEPGPDVHLRAAHPRVRLPARQQHGQREEHGQRLHRNRNPRSRPRSPQQDPGDRQERYEQRQPSPAPRVHIGARQVREQREVQHQHTRERGGTDEQQVREEPLAPRWSVFHDPPGPRLMDRAVRKPHRKEHRSVV